MQTDFSSLDGCTPTEKILTHLSGHTFFSLWSFSNPYKDDKHEMCDLIAVFDNNIFIFFDKHIKHLENSQQNTKDIEVNWKRWKKKAIDGQIRTAKGAERYIRSGRKVFSDKTCEKELLLKINLETVNIHKIVIAHGAVEACKKHSDGNINGSLAINYYDKELEMIDSPFVIYIDKEDPIHIFDSHNLSILFKELDTIYDFSNYLNAKKDAIDNLQSLVYSGEEDLLAFYYQNYSEKTQNHFIYSPEKMMYSNILALQEGFWEDFICEDVYKRKKEADRKSYVWDKLINKVISEINIGTIYTNSYNFFDNHAVFEMAKEPRFVRREISKRLLEAIDLYQTDESQITRSVRVISSFFKNKIYLFLQCHFPNQSDIEFREYRETRLNLLEVACGAFKNKYPQYDTIIGIAIDAPKYSNNRSEDLILMNCSDWSQEDINKYELINQSLKFFIHEETARSTIYEFPE